MRSTSSTPNSACAATEGLARFLRVRSIYPEGHRQNRLAAVSFLEAIQTYRATPASKVTMLFRNGEVVVDGQTLEVPPSVSAWLGRTFRRAHLAGLEIHGDAETSELELFADLFAACGQRESHALLDRWPSEFQGVSPLDLRFVGTHIQELAGGAAAGETDADGAAAGVTRSPDQDLVARLRSDPRVQARLTSLRAMFEAGLGAEDRDETIEIDLVSRVAALVSAEAGVDAARTTDLVEASLAELERELRQATKGGSLLSAFDTGIDDGLARLAHRVSELYFSTDAPKTTAEDDSLPTGRPEDAQIDDQPGLLLTEVAALPWAKDDRVLTTDAREEADHLARLLLNICIAPERPEIRARAAARLAEVLGAQPGLQFSGFRDTEALRSIGDRDVANQVLTDLVGAGLGDRLIADGVLDAARLLEMLPEGLRDWLPILEGASSGVVGVFADAISRLPRECLRPTLERLAEDKRLDPSVFGTLIRSNRPELLQLLEDAVAAGGWKATHTLAEALRQLPFAARIAAALRVLPEDWLAEKHLLELSRIAQGSGEPELCCKQAAQQLVRFISGSAKSDRLEQTRLEAIHTLSLYPDLGAPQYLRRLARPWWLGGKEARPARLKARETLRSIE